MHTKERILNGQIKDFVDNLTMKFKNFNRQKNKSHIEFIFKASLSSFSRSIVPISMVDDSFKLVSKSDMASRGIHAFLSNPDTVGLLGMPEEISSHGAFLTLLLS